MKLADVHLAALGVVHDGGPDHEPGVDVLGVAGDAIAVRHDARSKNKWGVGAHKVGLHS